MSYSQRVFWKQSQGCKQCQMLPQRYRYVQLRKQITYVGSTSQACIFLPRDGPVIAIWNLFFWIGCFFLIRIELNQIVCLSIRGPRWMLANERFQTTGRTALWALTLACLMPVRPIYHLSVFSTHELDAWQKDPRIVPVYAVSLDVTHNIHSHPSYMTTQQDPMTPQWQNVLQNLSMLACQPKIRHVHSSQNSWNMVWSLEPVLSTQSLG